MKNLLLPVVCLISLGLIGCSGGDAPMDKKEEDALRNPSKTMSPEAQEAMKNLDANVKKAQEANQAAGVDSRGVPLSKSQEGAGGPPTGN